MNSPQRVVWMPPPGSTPASVARTSMQAEGDARAWRVRLGLWLRAHRGVILAMQWTVVLFYAVVVALPAFLPLPGEADRILNHLTRFAQFLFWGLWWPFVILSVMTLGRVWCGLLCPEGALSEWAARHSLNRRVPAWLKWGGWPFTAFVLTTVFGQMVSVYEYPKPALLILGGSTLAAIAVGLMYGRGKRVWCRYLCPVSGVFGLLARVAPLHFAVDRIAWEQAARPGPAVSCTAVNGTAVNCAPLIDLRRMQSAAHCHMCGRCAGQRGAVHLAVRSPEAEILHAGRQGGKTDALQTVWQARLLSFGLLGVALGAFQWSASPWFIAAKQGAATWLIEREIVWPLESPGQWWLLTHYPELNDVFTWLDGGLLLAYIGATALLVGGWVRLCLGAGRRGARVGSQENMQGHAQERSSGGWASLALSLIPFAGASVFVGLSLLTTGQLFGEGIVLAWAPPARLSLLVAAALWSMTLAWRGWGPRSAFAVALATALPLWAWYQQFYVW